MPRRPTCHKELTENSQDSSLRAGSLVSWVRCHFQNVKQYGYAVHTYFHTTLTSINQLCFIDLKSRRRAGDSRVKDVGCNVHKVRNEVDVALRTSTAALGAEGLLKGKAEEEEPNVVSKGVEGGVIQASAVLKVGVVPAQQEGRGVVKSN